MDSTLSEIHQILPATMQANLVFERMLRQDAEVSVACVRDLRSGTRVTLKRIHGRGGGLAESLATEFALLQGISHPNLTRVLEFGADEQGVWLLREYVDGPTLAEAGAGLSAAERRRVLCGILAGLAHLHGLSILHLDVKPENILLRQTDGGWRAVLTDFGFAAASVDEAAPDSPLACGTPPFIAPEMLLGLPRDARADLFALGATWLLSGPHAPLVEPRLLYTRFPHVGFVEALGIDLAEVDADYAALLERMLATSPHDRPPSAAALLRELDAGETWHQNDVAPLLRPPPAFAQDPGFQALCETARLEGGRRACLVVAASPADLVEADLRLRFEAARAGVHVTALGGQDDAVDATFDPVARVGANRSDVDLARARRLLEQPGRRLLCETFGTVDPERCNLAVAVARELSAWPGEPSCRLIVLCLERDAQAWLAAFPTPPVYLRKPTVAFLAAHLRRLESDDGEPLERHRLLAQALLDISAGDPEAIAAVLAAELSLGHITQDRGQLDLSRIALETLSRPPGIEQELARLPPAERQVLALFALCGQSWTRRAAGEVLTREELQVLAGLVVRHKLAAPEGQELRVAQPALAALALEQTPPAAVRELASRILAAEARPASTLVLARLLALAGRHAEAAAVALRSTSTWRAPPGATLDGLLGEIARACAAEPAVWRDLMMSIGTRDLATGRLQQALAVFTELLADESLAAETRCQLLVRCGDAHLLSGNAQAALAEFQRARRLAARPTTRLTDELKFALDRGIAFARFQQGDVEGAHNSLEAVLRRRPDGADGTTLRLKIVIGTFALRAGRSARARELLDEVARDARDAGNDEILATAQTNRATLLQRDGQWTAARDALHEALQIRSRLGHRIEEALILNNLGITLREAGELARAADVLTESLRLRRVMNDEAGCASVLANLGQVEHLRGDLIAAREHLGEALATFRRQKAPIEYGLTACRLAGVEIHCGDLTAAGALLAEITTPSSPRIAGEQALARARLSLAQADASQAAEFSTVAMERFLAAGDLPGAARARLLQVDLRLAMDDAAGAARLLRDTNAGAPPRLRPEQMIREATASLRQNAVEEGITMLLRARDEARGMGLALPRAQALLTAAQALAAAASPRAAALIPEARLALLSIRVPGLEGTADPALVAARVFGMDIASLLAMNSQNQLETASSGRVVSEGIPDEVFRTFVAINRNILRERNLDRLLEQLLDHAVALSGARRGFIVLMRDGRVLLEFRSSELDAESEEISRSIVLDAIRQKRPLVTANARSDQRLVGRRSIENFDLRSVLCVPFDSGHGTEGAIYVDNPIREGVFTSRGVELLEALAGQAAIVIGNLEQIREIERLNTELSRRVEQREQELRDARRELARPGTGTTTQEMIAESAASREVIRLAERVAACDLSILILGESGTGKEVMARLVHRRSHRSTAPFVAENCSAVPETLLESEFFGYTKGAFTGADADREGLFQRADGGTLFLDEIGDMPPSLQSKLLRVLQERAVRPVGSARAHPIDVRMIFATNRDLEAMVKEGTFREDLYYRVRGATLVLPPLRNRTDDIVPLARHFLERLNERHGTAKRLSPPLLRQLVKHLWPGNVRELESEVTRLYHIAADNELTAEEFHAVGGPGAGAEDNGSVILVKPIQDIEKDAIRLALMQTGGNREEAARRLKISRAAFYVKLKKYALADEAPPSRRRRDS